MIDSACNKQTGHCDGRCKPGYTNAFCSKGKFEDNLNTLLLLKVNIDYNEAKACFWTIQMQYLKNFSHIYLSTDVKWLKYCRYGEKKPINQSIDLRIYTKWIHFDTTTSTTTASNCSF